MAHAFHQLYYHLIWATHSRYPYIQREWRPELLKLVNEETIERGGQPIRHNAMPDHVHLLVRLPPTIAVNQFIGQVNGLAFPGINAWAMQKRGVAMRALP